MSYSENVNGSRWKKIYPLEQEIAALQEKLHNPLFTSQTDQVQQACQQLDLKQKELEKLFQRWEELESKQ